MLCPDLAATCDLSATTCLIRLRPACDLFPSPQEPQDDSREICLKRRMAALFKELQETASVAKDQERLLARYRSLVSEVLEKLANGQVAEALAMIIRFQDGRRT